MADEKKPLTGFEDVGKNNDEVKRKLEGQSLMVEPAALTAQSLADTGGELDKLAREQAKAKGQLPEGGDEGDKGDEGEAGAVKPTDTPPPDPDDTAAKAAAEKVEAERAAKEAELQKAEEFFKDTPKLPANASPKSSEAFSSVKIKAAQEIAAREAELEKVRKEKAELEDKLKNPIPPETENELKELREWRAKLDVEADPSFKEFDKKVGEAREFVYAQLQKSPAVTPEILEQIKKYGGPDMVKMDKLWEAIKDPAMQRIVESKLADIEMAKFNKEQAIKTAKENIQTYLAQRTEGFEKARTSHNEQTVKAYQDISAKALDWMKLQDIDPKADAEKQKAAKEHNDFVTNVQDQIAQAFQDDSPQMRAILLTGMAQLLRLQKIHEATIPKMAALEKENAELNAKLAKFKNVSLNRVRESGAPTDGKMPEKKDGFGKLINTPAVQAVDDLARSIHEARLKAGGNQ